MEKTNSGNYHARNGIKYESFDEFESSFFKNVYKSAFVRLQNIINENEYMSLKAIGGKEEKRHQEFSNILTFIGKRGTGKTSAMLSFMESLKDYNRTRRFKNSQNMFFKFKQDNIEFSCLDCIDGSLLERGEDIFKIVLAQMYQKFLDLDKRHELSSIGEEGEGGYRNRELLEKFENLYKVICRLDSMSEENVLAGESYMSSLRNLASSQKIKETFEQLVRNYLSNLRYRSQNFSLEPDQHFLIVTVDDLDLNIQNGFSMLERIHRYLMVPNVIVLLSLDYEQTLLIGRKNFYKVLPKVDSVLNEGMSSVQKVTIDYLEKVLPINYRVYMPEVIEFSSNENQQLNSYGKQKKFLMCTLLEKSGVAFDSQGLKPHFYEPKSIRMLSNFLMSMRYMENLDIFDSKGIIKSSPKDAKAIWEMNYHFLKADLSTRLCVEKIVREEDKAFFNRVLATDVRRGIEMVIDFGREKIKEKVKLPSEYSYGIFINTLYYLGRVEAETYKPLVHCLLAYFSYEIFKIYLYEKYDIKDTQGNPITAKGTFKSIVSDSVAGIWNDLFLPKILLDKVKTKDSAIDTNRENSSHIDIEDKVSIDQTKRKVMRSLFSKELPEVSEFWMAKNFRENAREDMPLVLKNYILNTEILFMSLNQFQISGTVREDQWGCELSRIRKENSVGEMIVPIMYVEDDNKEKITSINAKFDIFAFIENSIGGYERLKKFEEALVKAIEQYYCKKTGYEQLSFSTDGLLAQKYQMWKKKYRDDIPFPLYWIDMSYNIIKREKRRAEKENPEGMDENSLFKYMRKVYRNLKNQLESQEKFYDKNNKRKTSDKTINISEKFAECPYVEYFLEDANIEQKQQYFADIVSKLL